jgi:hypothetical protein
MRHLSEGHIEQRDGLFTTYFSDGSPPSDMVMALGTKLKRFN